MLFSKINLFLTFRRQKQHNNFRSVKTASKHNRMLLLPGKFHGCIQPVEASKNAQTSLRFFAIFFPSGKAFDIADLQM